MDAGVESRVIAALFLVALVECGEDVELPAGSFSQDVYSARVQINISSDFQISSLIQYDNQSRSLGTNSRLRWSFSPLGDLFVVYNHNLERAFNDRFHFDSNQLLVKLQYALRL